MKITNKVKAQNAINWLEALLSGQYKQGKHLLGNAEKGFCCWGLGCYIVGLEYNPNNSWNGNLNKFIGFKDEYGRLKVPLNGLVSLARLNDAETSFEEIAKHLIKYSKDEFELHVGSAIKKHFKS